MKIRLTHPKDKGTITPNRCRLQWEPLSGMYSNKKLLYSMTIYATRRIDRPGRRSKPLPLFTTRMLKRNFFDIPIRKKGLKAGRTYWWRVEARNKNGQVVAISDMHRFRVRQPRVPVNDTLAGSRIPFDARYILPEDLDSEIATNWWRERHTLLPYPPVVWGKPVKLRRRDESGPDSSGSGTPGDIEPLALVWDYTAAEIYLPVYFVEHANVYWDLSDIVEGCHRVMLQVSGQDGFSEPYNGNVMEDENLINYYWGPPQISCGINEIETLLGSEEVSPLVQARDLDLFNDHLGGGSVLRPNDISPEVIRQIRTVPCDENLEPVGVASDPVTIRCVQNPGVWLRGPLLVDFHWGEAPGRVIEFNLGFGERFPNVRIRELYGPDVPCTLLISTPPGPWNLDSSTCSNLSLTMNGVPVESRNSIVISQGGSINDTYVIHFTEWPGELGCDFRLEQQWDGAIVQECLWDFLTPAVSVVLVPGIHPSWRYCGGILQGYDSLYGRDDLPEDPTWSPFYYLEGEWGRCGENSNFASRAANPLYIENFNEFMESTFRGTRTVTHEERIVDFHLDEPEGTHEVEVHFHTEETGDLRFIMHNLNKPVMMRETRETGEVLWKVHNLDGKVCALGVTGDRVGINYGGQAGSGLGRSQLDPPRLQMWLSVGAGRNAAGYLVNAEIYYDLRAELE